MPRQNRWSQEELEDIFDGYLGSQSAKGPLDVFSEDEFEDTDDTFDFLEEGGRPEGGRPEGGRPPEVDFGPGRPEGGRPEGGRPEALDFGTGRHKKLYVPEFAPEDLETPQRNLMRLLGQSQQ